jgi:putative hydrolase of the HAD superfamily
MTIPYEHIDVLSLDVGNTLISIDFDHLAEGLAAFGLTASADALRRAEAAARPRLSNHFARPPAAGSPEPFVVYLGAILAHLPGADRHDEERAADVVARAVPVIRGERASRLWRTVMPRVPEALARFRELGLSLVVVSNSDGTVEQSLVDAGLRSYFDAVIDSAVVGYEKPDPRIFMRALELVGARAERTLHIGDLYDADVVGAWRAGLHALLLDPFGDWGAIDCDSVADLWTVAERFPRRAGRGA